MSPALRFLVLSIFAAYAHGYVDVLQEGAPSFSYLNNGPALWSESSDACAALHQSPVSLTSCSWTKELPALKFSGHWDSRPDGIVLVNTGHAALIQYTGVAPTLRGGPLQGEYTLGQAHFHWGQGLEGSEHQMHGKFFGMELHFVHYKTEYGSVSNALNFKDGLSVVGLMFRASDEESHGLEAIVHGLSSVEEAESSVVLAGDAMAWTRKLLEHPGPYYTYSGSLTTPPCSEVVTWINLRRSTEIGVEQIAEFRTLVSHEESAILENRRPIQAINDRTVRCSV